MKRFMFLTFLVLLIAATTTAKGMMDKIIIIAPDGNTLEVTDTTMTESLSMAALEIFPQSIDEPDGLGEGYVLKRQFKDGDSYQTFDVVLYYPAGNRGYVFYGGLVNGWSEYDGKWFEASETGVKAMKKIVTHIKLRYSLGQRVVLN